MNGYYVIKIIDNETGTQIQKSFAYPWAKCEEVYFLLLQEWREEGYNCYAVIEEATGKDMVADENVKP